jgi:hypothetical protein
LLAASIVGVAYFATRALFDWRARENVIRSITEGDRTLR